MKWNATFDPFVGTLTTTTMASCTSSQWQWNFQNGPNGPNSSWILILWLSRTSQGRWKRISSPNANLALILKKGSRHQKSRRRTCGEEFHSHFNTLPSYVCFFLLNFFLSLSRAFRFQKDLSPLCLILVRLSLVICLCRLLVVGFAWLIFFCGRMFDFWSFVQPGTDFGRVFDQRMRFDRLLDPIQFFGRVFNLRRSFGIVLPVWERFCSCAC